MTRILLPSVVKVSQMDDPVHGTGTGGDRCSEAVAAMIDGTYKLGPSAQAGADPEQIMYDLTAYLNQGGRTSALEDFSVWFPPWLADHQYSQVSLNHLGGQSFADCKAVVDRGHMAVLYVRDYSQLTAYDGSDPYQWNPAGAHVGHYVALTGYDDDFRGTGPTLIVNDPLRGTSGQPWDYSWASFVAAGLADIMEVVGAPLPALGASGQPVTPSSPPVVPSSPPVVPSSPPVVSSGGATMGVPGGWQDDGATLTAPNGVMVRFGFRAWVLAHNWAAENHPLAGEYATPSVEPLVNPATGAGSRQDFHEGSLGYTPARGVFALWIGDEIAALSNQLAQLEAQVKQLTAAQTVDLAGLKSDVAALESQLAPLEAQLAPLKAAEQTIQDMEKKLG